MSDDDPTTITAPADSSVTVTPPEPENTSKLPREPHSQAWIVSALAVAGIVMLAALGHDVPPVLEWIASSAVTGAAALSYGARR